MKHPHFGYVHAGDFVHAVHARAIDHMPTATAYQRFNRRAAIAITGRVGTMTCAWVFSVLSLCSLPAILSLFGPFKTAFPTWLITASIIALVSWVTQSFIQLVLLPIIIVGQNIASEASDARAAKQFTDVEKILDALNLDTSGGLTAIKQAVDSLSDNLARAIVPLLNKPASEVINTVLPPLHIDGIPLRTERAGDGQEEEEDESGHV